MDVLGGGLEKNMVIDTISYLFGGGGSCEGRRSLSHDMKPVDGNLVVSSYGRGW